MYKEALMIGLKFQTTVGILSVEQVFSMSTSQLSTTIRGLGQIIKDSKVGDIDFLDDNVVTKEVELNELRFNILKDVYLTKMAAIKDRQAAESNKAHNKMIDNLIADKQENALKSMSIEDLEKLRR